MSNMDETAMSSDGTEVAAGYQPDHAWDEAEPAAEVTPTQVQQPVQAARRTLVQYVAAVLSALIVAGMVRIGLSVPADVAQAVGVVVGAAVSWLVAWAMAQARANAWLTTIGLGATPKG